MSAARVIGIDAGGTKLLGGVVDGSLAVRERVHRFWRGRDRDEVLDVFVQAVEEARAAAPDVAAVGFGIPSVVDAATGSSEYSVHLPLAGVSFREVMAERLGLPVWVDNDANLALLAEARAGAARGARHAVMLTLGTGIGGGLLLDGRLYRGARGGGAELGHVVVDIDGPPCQGGCPNRGCLETLASGSAIGREGAAAAARAPESALGRALLDGREVTGGLVTEVAHDGDAVAIEVLALVGRRLGAGLASLVNAFQPEVVVIGGGAVAAGELLLGPAREVVMATALPPLREGVRVVAAELAAEAGLIGAGILALERGEV
ncbi:MAG TPA: ROK family protein [Thermoleophilaceae bacterium]|jgi:glucokinase